MYKFKNKKYTTIEVDMQLFAPKILNDYVDSYKLQIQTIELYKQSNNHEQKFLYYIVLNTFKIINLIETYIKNKKQNNESFEYLKLELKNSLEKSYLNKNLTTTQNIYQKFQNLIKNVEKNLKFA